MSFQPSKAAFEEYWADMLDPSYPLPKKYAAQMKALAHCTWRAAWRRSWCKAEGIPYPPPTSATKPEPGRQ